QVFDMRTVKPAADQYASAATLYWLLTGQNIYPPAKTITDLFKQILETEPVPILQRRPDLPAALAGAIHKALAREPENRYRDVRAFAEALKPFA
ncbi:MAG: serine/threonine protein kinase, partial [Planctomycetes bacterium]|nr:serine/threonine protein kinase [Planctomycetota bacterium]